MRETFFAGQKSLVLEDYFEMMNKDLEVAPSRVGIHSFSFEFLSNIQNAIEFKSVEKKYLDRFRNRKNVLVISAKGNEKTSFLNRLSRFLVQKLSQKSPKF
jgi:type IV secretory pathway ATPase VirB11/archaellum biosynthesis ATPase